MLQYYILSIILFFTFSFMDNIASAKVANFSSDDRVAYSLVKEKKYKEAISFLEAIPKGKYTYRSYYVLGEAYRLSKRYEKAIFSYKLGISLFSNKVEKKEKAIIHSALGYVYSKLDKYDFAIVSYLSSLEYLPRNHIILSNLGKSYLKVGSHEDALKSFNMALEISPSYSIAINGLARTYFELGYYKKSVFFYNKLHELSPSSKDAYFGLAYNLDKLGKKAFSYKMFARAYFLSKDYKNSIVYIKKVPAYKKDKDIYKLLLTNYIYLKEYNIAEREVNKAIKRYRRDSEFIFIKAQLFFIKKNYKLSKDIAIKGIKLFRESHKLYVILGGVCAKLGEKQSAIVYYMKALDLKEDDILTRERLAHIYRKDGIVDLEFFHQGVAYFFSGDYYQAQKVLEWVNAESFKEKSKLAYYKGMVLWASGEKDKSVEYFISSIKEEDSFSLAYLALARAYNNLNKRDMSFSLLEEYMRKYPKSSKIEAIKKLYNSMKQS